ncbi:hypothetical protein QTP86_013052 [Hemibagrus guttatus]|nr:hypothetical protein QTP86_013052 [Hemibagrus guttatus]
MLQPEAVDGGKSVRTAKIQGLRAGDKDALKTAWAKLSQAIREAKCAHSQRIHGHFQSSSDTCMWQGIQSITNYRPASPACDSDASLLDALNSFYARFEAPGALSHHGRHEENYAELTHGKLLDQTTFQAECPGNVKNS